MKLLTIEDVMSLCHVGYSTIHRWRKSGDFPEPVTGGGKKLLWTESQIIQWMGRHNTVVKPLTVSPSTQQRKKQKSFEQRQEVAKAVLQQHDRREN
jgi:Predicted transcriptional regulator